MTTPDHYADLVHRVRQRYAASNTFDRQAFNTDPVYHASVEMICKMFAATDEALAAEGIDEPTRDRVLYRLLYGEEPNSYPVPDSHEALARVHAREEQLLLMARQPLVISPESWR